jgi:hypothetical protein
MHGLKAERALHVSGGAKMVKTGRFEIPAASS